MEKLRENSVNLNVNQSSQVLSKVLLIVPLLENKSKINHSATAREI